MASDFRELDTTGRPTEHSELQDDRIELAKRLGRPVWLSPGFGAVAAAYVASPAIPDGTWRDLVLPGAVVATVALLTAYQRTTGIKLSSVGWRAGWYFGGAVAFSLTMLSVSFGLDASGFAWWIAAPVAATFVVVAWLVGLLVAAARDHISRGI